jgi:hypothetical protein
VSERSIAEWISLQESGQLGPGASLSIRQISEQQRNRLRHALQLLGELIEARIIALSRLALLLELGSTRHHAARSASRSTRVPD